MKKIIIVILTIVTIITSFFFYKKQDIKSILEKTENTLKSSDYVSFDYFEIYNTDLAYSWTGFLDKEKQEYYYNVTDNNQNIYIYEKNTNGISEGFLGLKNQSNVDKTKELKEFLDNQIVLRILKDYSSFLEKEIKDNKIILKGKVPYNKIEKTLISKNFSKIKNLNEVTLTEIENLENAKVREIELFIAIDTKSYNIDYSTIAYIEGPIKKVFGFSTYQKEDLPENNYQQQTIEEDINKALEELKGEQK